MSTSLVPTPVLTIDGPGGAGKGTVSQLVAAQREWRYLDSGALYRVVALAASDRGVPLDADAAVGKLAATLAIEFQPQADGRPARVFLDGIEVSDRVRTEDTGRLASQVAVLPAVREALLSVQRGFRTPPGLVADGRDMGTTVFPDANLKIFLTASPEIRAARRHKQLIEKGLHANLPQLLGEIRDRDARDSTRAHSPLLPAVDAVLLDSSSMSIDEVVAFIQKRLDECLR
jgi:cytidylate kinase